MSIYTSSGLKKSSSNNAKKEVTLKVNSSMYINEYMEECDTTAKNVLHALLKYMDDDMNTIQVSGDMLESLMNLTEYNDNTIRKALVRLNKLGLAEKTDLRGEYIINPLFAVKGNEDSVWLMYKKIELNKRNKK